MGWGGAKPPNQKQNLRGALRTFSRLGLFALMLLLIVGAWQSAELVWKRLPFDQFFLANMAFWAISIFALVGGFGLGGQLGRAWTHRQRWRHAAPWLLIILACVALAWVLGETVSSFLAPGNILFGPVAVVFGVMIGVVDFRRPDRTAGG